MPITSNLDSGKIAPIMQEYNLPSYGLTYDGKFGPLVTVRPYSFNTEKILLTNLKGSEKLVKIAAAVTHAPSDFDINNFLMADILTILAIARGLTYGEEYSFRATCPECGTKENCRVKVPTELSVKTWADYSTKEDLEKAMEFNLPIGKDRVAIKLLTIGDEISLERTATQNAAASRTDIAEERYMIRLAMQLRSVNGGVPDNLQEAREYIKRLEGENMVTYERTLDAMSIGIVFAWKIACDGCGFQYDANVPMGTGGFFRRN